MMQIQIFISMIIIEVYGSILVFDSVIIIFFDCGPVGVVTGTCRKRLLFLQML